MRSRRLRPADSSDRRERSLFRVSPEFFEDEPEPDRAAHEEPPEDAVPSGPQSRWLNRLIALLLAPLIYVWANTFFTIFYKETVEHGFWRTEEFYHFFLGADIALLAFFGLRGPIDVTVLWRIWVRLGRGFLWGVSLLGMRRWFLGTAERLGWTERVDGPKRCRILVLAYVFGHELTHAVWVWLMGGRIGDFKVGSQGGYITTNKQNFWIALAPYFYPIYSVAVVIVYAVAALLIDLAPHTRWLFFAIGMTWSFHICFTLWMIPKGQSDLTDHGTAFSLAVILLMNLAVITGLVLLTAPGATFGAFFHQFIHNSIALAHQVMTGLRWVLGPDCLARPNL